MEPAPVTSRVSVASLQVDTSDVRPQLWKTATREVLYSEVDRRVRTGWRPLPSLPLLAVPVAALGTTPERVEADAHEQVEISQKMLEVFERAEAPSGVKKVFSEHVRAMKTACSPATERRVPPTLVLLDGAHRWYTANELGTEHIWVSIPAEYQEMYSASTASGATDSAPTHAGAGYCTAEVPSVTAVAAANTGAHMNFLSHMTTRMTVADRVFLLGSWYNWGMEACRDFEARLSLHGKLGVKNVYNLLCFSIYRDAGEAAGDSVTFESARTQGQLLSEELDGDKGLNLYGTKIPLPPPFVLVVAPEREGETPRLCVRSEDIVRCALATALSPIARKLTGAILRSELEPDEDSSVDLDSEAVEAATVVKDSSSDASVHSLLSVRAAISASVAFVSEQDLVLLECLQKPRLDRLEASLAILYSIQKMTLQDPAHDEQALKGKVLRRRVSWRCFRNIGKRGILCGVLKGLVRLWEEGVPLGEIADNVARVNVDAMQGHRILGRTVGREFDRGHFSAVVGTGPPKSIGNEVPKHSLRCVLLQADGGQCVCDWYTDHVARSGDMISKAWFITKAGVPRLQGMRSGQEAGISPQDKSDLVALKAEQLKIVSKVGRQMDGTISDIDAFLMCWRTTESEQEEHELLALLGVLKNIVNGLLITLHNLAHEVGLHFSRELPKYFKNAHQSLSRLEEAWNGEEEGIQGLGSFLEKCRAREQMNFADCVAPPTREQDVPMGCDVRGVEVLARWKSRVLMIERLLGKISRLEREERQKDRQELTQKRARAQTGAMEKRKAAEQKRNEERDERSAQARARAAKRARDAENTSNKAQEVAAAGSWGNKRTRNGGTVGAGKKQSKKSGAGVVGEVPGANPGQITEGGHAGDRDATKCTEDVGASSTSTSAAVKHPRLAISGPSLPQKPSRKALQNAIFKEVRTHDFDDRASKVPDEVVNAAMSTLDDRLAALPPQIRPGANAAMFIDVSTAHSIKKWAANAVEASFAGKGGSAAYARMSNVGYFCLRDVFLGECGAKTDAEVVTSAVLSKLKLAPHDGEKLRDTEYTIRIPNLDHRGRSQTGRGYWSKLETSGKDENWEPARAFHRLVTRTCWLVDEVMSAGRARSCACNDGICDNVSLICPNTGGRVLVSHPPSSLLPKGGSAQYPHMDFCAPKNGDQETRSTLGVMPTPNHSTPLFVMCTGEQGAALRVLPGSSTWGFASEALRKEAFAHTEWELEWIPPFSFFAMRGDCIHAGAAFLEAKWLHECHGYGNIDLSNGIARFHMYFTTPMSGVSNNVHYAHDEDRCPVPQNMTDPDHFMFPTTNGREFKSVSADGTFTIAPTHVTPHVFPTRAQRQSQCD